MQVDIIATIEVCKILKVFPVKKVVARFGKKSAKSLRCAFGVLPS